MRRFKAAAQPLLPDMYKSHTRMILMTGATVFGPKNRQFFVLDYLGNSSFGTVYKVAEESGTLNHANEDGFYCRSPTTRR
jgi:hypothetical protein